MSILSIFPFLLYSQASYATGHPEMSLSKPPVAPDPRHSHRALFDEFSLWCHLSSWFPPTLVLDSTAFPSFCSRSQMDSKLLEGRSFLWAVLGTHAVLIDREGQGQDSAQKE